MRLFAGTVAELLFNTFLSKRVLLITGRATQTGFLPHMNMEGRTQVVCPSYRLFEAFSMISFCGCQSVSVCKCACVSVCVCVSVSICKCVCAFVCVVLLCLSLSAILFIYWMWILDFVCVCVIYFLVYLFRECVCSFQSLWHHPFQEFWMKKKRMSL